MSILFRYGLLLEGEEEADHSVITLKYRTGATSALCEAATYQEYTIPFDSEGFVQLRVEG